MTTVQITFHRDRVNSVSITQTHIPNHRVNVMRISTVVSRMQGRLWVTKLVACISTCYRHPVSRKSSQWPIAPTRRGKWLMMIHWRYETADDTFRFHWCSFAFNTVRKACQSYKFHEDQPKVYQFFDAKFYDGKAGPLFNVPLVSRIIDKPLASVKVATINGGLIGNIIG